MAEEKTFNIPVCRSDEIETFCLPKPFRHPVSICVSGTTGSGKTTWIKNFIKCKNSLFENEPPKHILYCYGIYQDLYDKMKNEFNFVTFHEGLPSRETVFSLRPFSMIILDDLSHKIHSDVEIELLFSQVSHHRNISVCILKNNLFYQGKSSRTIALNTNIYVLMKNPADIGQINLLARRIFPRNPKHLTDSYMFSVNLNDGRGYLVVDLTPNPTTDITLKTGIFPNEDLILFKYH